MQYSLLSQEREESVVQLFTQTFSDSEGENEGELIGKLVKDFFQSSAKNELYVFIGKENEQLVSAVLFSPLRFELSNANIWLLSPMAVRTTEQGKGIGQRLLQFALNYLRKGGVEGVVSYGDINFYSKVGFAQIFEDVIPSPFPLSYPEGWIAQSLQGHELKPISGKSFCVEALNNQDYW